MYQGLQNLVVITPERSAIVEKVFQLVRSKTVEFYILNSRGLFLGSPEGYPTMDFLHIQPQTTTFNHTPHNRVLSNCSTKLCWVSLPQPNLQKINSASNKQPTTNNQQQTTNNKQPTTKSIE